VLFENCFTSVPLTLPSHCSIFTGVYPYVHGVRDNGIHFLPEQAFTLAEYLQSRGYFTAASVGSYPLKKKFGLSQGFDLYDDSLPSPSMHGVSGLAVTYNERPASAVTDAALRISGEASEAPLFLWVHYFDPHIPYSPPQPFQSYFADRPYDGEIAYADSETGRLLTSLSEIRKGRKRIVVVLSDHGEGLGEHGERTHGDYLFDTTLRIPFIINGWEDLPGGYREKTPVREIDIMPTVIEMLGFQVPPSCEGISLVPLLADSKPFNCRLYAETLHPKIHYGWNALLSLREGEWKFIDGKEPLLFNTVKDPGETRNYASYMSDRVDEMREKLRRLYDDSTTDENRLVLGKEDITRLKALGYMSDGDRLLDSRRTSSSPDRSSRDEILGMLSEARSWLEKGDIEKTLEIVDRVLPADPDNKQAYFLRGIARGMGGDYVKARNAFDRALQIDPFDGRIVENLAFMDFREGQYESAARGFERATELIPHDEKAYEFLVEIYLELDRPEKAVESYERWMEIEPERGDLYRDAGVILAYDLRNVPRAIEYWEKALELNPDDPQAPAIRAELSRLGKALDTESRH
jgi:tetratricopeptide (TPR) repeat protein